MNLSQINEIRQSAGLPPLMVNAAKAAKAKRNARNRRERGDVSRALKQLRSKSK